ncbi:MAG: methyltransferase family protein [Planctomycetota bacterium]
MSTLTHSEPVVEPNRRTHQLDLGRATGFLFGIGTQLLFLLTVVYLFLFLRYCSGTSYAGWWWSDALMAAGFAVPHSILLAPPVQKWMRGWLPAGLVGCLHCTVTCVTLLLMFGFWGSSGVVLWEAGGWVKSLILGCFYLSWVALLYSLYCTGLGYHTGLTQWWYWWTQTKPPRRPFLTSGAFRYMRHPVYMSFLGLVWFTPTMTLDHAILTTVWTIYIYAGSWFKDRRLLHFIGEDYRAYARRVPGLPLIGFGSLNRFKA